MTWTYNRTPSTGSTGGRRDAVRLLLKDVTQASPLLHDEEIAFYLSQNGNHVWRAAADAADGLAAREAESKTIGDLAISGFGTNWANVARRFRVRADMQATPFAGGISIAQKESEDEDTDRVTPAFTRAMMANPESTGAST